MNARLKANRRIGFWCALSLLCRLLLAANSHAADLQLEAKPPASVAVVFPFSVGFTLRNVGDKPIVINDFPRAHVLRITIKKVATGTIEHEGFANPIEEPGSRAPRPVTLEPGKAARFETVIGAKWNENGEALGAAFVSPGEFSLQFTLPAVFRENEQTKVEYLRSAPATILITNPPAQQQGALTDLRTMPNVVWLLHPRAAELAPPADLEKFEASLRKHLSKHPNSPWSGMAKLALANRLHAKAILTGSRGQDVQQEITNLLHDASAEGQFYRNEALQTQKRVERVSKEARAHAKAKTSRASVTQDVEAQFQSVVNSMASGDTNAIAPLLSPGFRYDARLNASEWLTRVKRDHDAAAPFPLTAEFKTISVKGSDNETTLVADVTFTSGGRRSVRRVEATFQSTGATWALSDWKNVSFKTP